MRRLPQVLLNVRVAARRDVASVPALAAAIARAERALGERGRVLVRYSGTEPLLRIMVEGDRAAEIRDLAETIAAAARSDLGEAAPAAHGA
jgi:phosphoglucosamine mutase